MDLLRPRRKLGFGWPESLVLLAYCGLLLWCIPHHESWFDEAQAWLIARDSTLFDLVVHRLHYEGAPALWYVLLWIEIRLHVSLLGMHYITGVIAAGGVYVWLRYSPLPRIFTLLMPFTYFLQYEYAVVAREYVLCPLFAFVLMALLENRKSSPMLFFVTAGLMANCSAHMFAFAVGMVIWYWRDRRKTNEGTSAGLRRRLAVPAAVFVLFLGVAAATAWPTADGNFGGASIRWIRRATSGMLITNGTKVGSVDKRSSNGGGGAVSADDKGNVQELVPNGQGRASNATPGFVLLTVLGKIVFYLSALLFPISTSNLIAVAFLALLFVNLARARLWISLLPCGLVFAVCVLLGVSSHHTGLLWLAMLCSLWALCGNAASRTEGGKLPAILYAITLLVVVLQMGWSIHCLSKDVYGAYSPAPETARFLQGLPAGTRIVALNDGAVTVNAYLPTSPYSNLKVAYWPTSKTRDARLPKAESDDRGREVAVAGISTWVSPFSNQIVQAEKPGTVLKEELPYVRLMERQHYHAVRQFCGEHFFRNSSEFKDCLVIYVPGGAKAVPAAR
ncbi:MAG TPA: hypothetical protein VFI20_08040 [Terracidiphilus sp.]|nr:hypothetical protein [Terracidiphilus sp.]